MRTDKVVRNTIRLKPGDVLVLSAIVVSSLLLVFRNLPIPLDESDGKVVVEVRIGGQNLLKVTEPGTYTLYAPDGRYVTTLKFDGQRAWVENSNCPDKVCEKMGKVGAGGSIICVPNRTAIEVKGQRKGLEAPDVQTW